MKISYAITACNEYVELENLLNFLVDKISKNDEIVILVDENNVHDEVIKVIQKIQSQSQTIDFNWYENPLNKDFAQQKNFLNSKCRGDYIFQIDADEIPNTSLISLLPEILKQNPDCEAYWVPRVNTVEGLTSEHIQKWGWRVDEKGWVNFPDFQMRIYKNKDEIHWVKPVHEQLMGYESFSHFPPNEDYCLYHPKEINRQERQNEFYNTI